ncbi:MAG: hypothetical protein J6X40_07240 [Bacteroidales bacterium]|nr:hypothetical protein [Bacteroidales bacterium]
MDPILREPYPVKRPAGMTFLLVLSLLNAIYQALSAIVLFFSAPVMRPMLESGQLEEQFRLFFPTMDDTMFEAVMDSMASQLDVNPFYYLIVFVLYIGSLIGVLKMFKLQRLGFHIYSIAQLLLLIASVVYVLPHQTQNTFFNEFLFTLLFILVYHLSLKRVELLSKQDTPSDPTDAPDSQDPFQS